METEEKEIVERGKALQDLVKSDGWQEVKTKIMDKIMELQSIMNLDSTDADQMVIDAKARVMSISCLKEWLEEVEGDAEQFENNYIEDEDMGYVVRD